MLSKNTAIRADLAYQALFIELQKHINDSKCKVALTVNRELLIFYWKIGHMVLTQQQVAKFGDAVIVVLAQDLQKSFPDSKGFSKTNLNNMKLFAKFYPNENFMQTAAGQLSWSHHTAIIQYAKSLEEIEWYVQQTCMQGWSFRQLVQQLKGNLFFRQGKAEHKSTNFLQKLPKAQSLLAQEIIKDPYRLDFLGIIGDVHEREIERALVKHIKQFLLELGAGFAFVGSQYKLRVGDSDFAIDMLMYHIKLHAYVVIELKRGKLKPTYASQLNFYLSAVDELLRGPDDNPSIGLLLCEEKDRVVAEYTLKDINKPIGISHYELIKDLPEKLQAALPAIEDIEACLNAETKRIKLDRREK